jgi:NAD(P)-dependent dehydrogenase (short-subunit alcohol dehydrogenase family)
MAYAQQQSRIHHRSRRGIGRATALTFAKNGYTIGGYDIDEVGLKSLADEIDELGGTAITGHLDVTDAGEMAQRVGEFAKAAGRLDVMINNAGILLAGRFEEIDVARHLKEIDINAKGVVNGLHAAFPYLRDTDNSVVVNLSSASAIYGQAELANYSATKFFVRGITEALDIEWQRYGIRVIAMWPLYVHRDDRSHQDRDHRIARHPADRPGRRRRDRKGRRTFAAAPGHPPGALPRRFPDQGHGGELPVLTRLADPTDQQATLALLSSPAGQPSATRWPRGGHRLLPAGCAAQRAA